MGIFDSGFIKAINATKRSVLLDKVSSVSSALTITLEPDKGLVLEVGVDGGANDAITLSFTGKDLKGTTGFFITNSSWAIDNPSVTYNSSTNKFSLPAGVSRFVMPTNIANQWQTVSISVTFASGTSAKLSLFERKVADILSSTVEITNPILTTVTSREKYTVNVDSNSVTRTLAGNKNYKITCLSATDTVDNYVSFIPRLAGGVFDLARIISNNTSRIDASSYVKVRSGEVYYLKGFSVQDIIFRGVGTGVGSFIVEEIDVIPLDGNKYTSILNTSNAVGVSGIYTRKETDKTVIIVVDTYLVSGSQSAIVITPRASTGIIETDVIPLGRTGFTQTTSGKSIYAVRVVDLLDNVHIAGTVTGTGRLHVNAIGIDKSIADTILKAPFYEDKDIVVSEYKKSISYFTRFENWEAYIDAYTQLNIEKDGVSLGKIALTSLPGWKSGDIIGAMGFIPYMQGGPLSSGYSRETSTRLCIFTRDGNIYHNYAAADTDDKTVHGVLDFDLGAIYYPAYTGTTALTSERIPKSSLAEVTNELLYRYEPGLPSWNYLQHTDNIGGTGYGNGGLPPVLTKNDVVHIRYAPAQPYGTNTQSSSNPYALGGHLSSAFSTHPKMTVFTPYVGVNAKRNIVLGTTDGGRTWCVLHEFGMGQMMSGWGNSLNLPSGSYSSGALSVSIREYNQPSEADKEPANAFKYKSPVAVTSISTSGGKTIITTSGDYGSGGITKGYIAFKKNSPGDYDYLANTVLDGVSTDTDTNSVGNGRFYAAKYIANNQFELLQCMGGVDEKIKAHHVHSSNLIKDGVIVATGEQYPDGWICYIPIHQIDDFESYDIWKHKINHPYIIRLNSTQHSCQRAVGCILNDDTDQSFYFSSDEAHIDRGDVTISGRTSLFKRNSAGIFKGKLSEIDDLSKAVCVLETNESSLGFERQNGISIFVGMSRCAYLNASDASDKNKWIKLKLLIRKYGGASDKSIFFTSTEGIVYRVDKK